MNAVAAIAGSRWIECPACGQQVRLTDGEVTSGLGFCASCDGRFSLGSQVLVGEGPGRAPVHRSVGLVAKRAAKPAGVHITVRSRGRLDVELRASLSQLRALSIIPAWVSVA